MAIDTESQILEAARSIFIKRGYSGARMQEIADEAGINKALLHYYFRSKEKLFDQVVQKAFLELVPQLKKAFASKGTILERIEKIVGAYIDYLSSNPHMPLFIMHELSQNRVDFMEQMKNMIQQEIPDFKGFVMQAFAEQETGMIRTVPPLHLILNVMSMSIFPFMVKPIFCNIMDVPEDDFLNMMKDRQEIIMDFMSRALTP